MKFFYGVYGSTENPIQVFIHKCKTYENMEESARVQYHFKEDTEIHFIEVSKRAYRRANEVFAFVENHPYVKTFFLSMIDGLNESITDEKSTNESIEDVFDAMKIMLNTIAIYMVKSEVSGKEAYVYALDKLEKGLEKNKIEKNTIDMMKNMYSKELNVLKNAQNTVIIH